MYLYSFFRVIKLAAVDFWRNLWLSLVVITIFILALLSYNFFIAFQHVAETAIVQVQNRIDLGIYLKTGAKPSAIEEIKQYFVNLPEVKEVKVVDAQAALESFKLKYQSKPELMAALKELGDNPLGSSIFVQAKDTQLYDQIILALGNAPHQELIMKQDYQDHKTVIATMNSIKQKVQVVVIGMISFFFLVAAFVLFNIIRIAIYAKREEIAIMKLVGATNTFIRMPFILSSLLYGTIALLLTMLIIFPFLQIVNPTIMNFFGGSSDTNLYLYFVNNFVSIFGIQLLTIVLLSIVASALSVGKYVKV